MFGLHPYQKFYPGDLVGVTPINQHLTTPPSMLKPGGFGIITLFTVVEEEYTVWFPGSLGSAGYYTEGEIRLIARGHFEAAHTLNQQETVEITRGHPLTAITDLSKALQEVREDYSKMRKELDEYRNRLVKEVRI